MWTARQHNATERVREYILQGEDGSDVSRAAVVELWRAKDDTFRHFFIDLLKSSSFSCFRFETPAVTRETVDQGFRFALIDSPEIDLPPDPAAFQAQFDASRDDILVFGNLGGDGTMIVPRPVNDAPGYAHIAGFLRHAPVTQQLTLWRTVGEMLHRADGGRPLWLNTAGGGVPWLHVRIDSRPKYYVFDRYRKPPPA